MICSSCGASQAYQQAGHCSNCDCRHGFFQPTGQQDKDLFDLLRCFPPEEPIKAHQVTALIGISSTTIREKVHEARLSGVPVCSDARGYYWASKAEELQPTLDQLRSRIRALQECATRVQQTQRELSRGRRPQFATQTAFRLQPGKPGPAERPVPGGPAGVAQLKALAEKYGIEFPPEETTR